MTLKKLAPSTSTVPLDDLSIGNFHRSISTTNQAAQLWFDRGLLWSFAFNRPAAATCFSRSVEADPDCALAYWGVSYASGPYYNQSWTLFSKDELQPALKQAFRAAKEAEKRAHRASPVERALIKAIQHRHPDSKPPKDFSEWDQNYASAMKDVFQQFGDNDLDITALYVDSLMVLTPWALWDPWSGKPKPNARTYDAKAVLEAALAHEDAYVHPGILHLYIHLMEMSRTPEVTLRAADHLRTLIPDAGHLVHMPSHIDILVGDYRRAIEANTAAIRADDRYLGKKGSLSPYVVYRAHNYHSLIYAALFAAQSGVALKYCSMLEETLPHNFLSIQSPPMANWAESFHAIRPHILIRFGMWQDILDLTIPKNQELYCYTTAITHYAKGVAWAALGNVEEAEKEQGLFLRTAGIVPPGRYDFPNRCIDILPVAEWMLAGEIEYRRGNVALSFEHLRKAISVDDNLGYSEPWSWMQPTRHAYGALLMEQARYAEAATVYEADLGVDQSLPRGHQYPNNIWSLTGYHECLIVLGRTAEARLLELPLKIATELADIDVAASCFCKRGVKGTTECCSTERGTKLTVANKL